DIRYKGRLGPRDPFCLCPSHAQLTPPAPPRRRLPEQRFSCLPSPCSRRRPGRGGAALAQTLKIKCGLNVKSLADRMELTRNIVNRRRAVRKARTAPPYLRRRPFSS